MKKSLQTGIFGTAALCLLSALPSNASARQRIAVEDEAPQIYCVGALDGNKGVYKISTEGDFSEDKISGTTYIQWGFKNSGGTFVSKEKAVGTQYNYGSLFAVTATAEGGEDGPWSHTFFNYRDPQTYVSYPSTLTATDMTFDEASGKVYGWFRADEYSVGEYNLAVYDYDAKTKSVVGGNSQTKIVALAASKGNVLWGIAENGTLYSIDKNTGELTSKGSLGVSSSGSGQSAAIDPATGKMYWATANTYDAALYSVDTEAYTATKIYDFPMGKRFNGFYIAAPDANPAAPAQPEALSATYNGTNVDVTFTVPDKTHGGDALSGNITYTIEIDGESADSGSTQPGAEVSKALDLADGPHTVDVYLSNRYGDSPKANASVFVGFDTPAAIGKPSISADGNEITVTWNAPEGANGGTVEPGKLTYSVTRNPGEETIAAGITGTQASDVIPAGYIKEYTYTVTAYFDGEFSSSATSDAIALGDPYSIPYDQNFNALENIDDEGCKQINSASNETMAWTLDEEEGNKFVRVAGDGYTPHKAYFFTAPIQFEAGVEYKLQFKALNNSDRFGSDIRITLAKTQTTTPEDHLYPFIKPSFNHQPTAENIGKFIDYTIDFTVPESGVYSICFLDQNGYWCDNTMGLDDIYVTDPANVSVKDVSGSEFTVKAANGRISVSAEGKAAAIYTADGRIVASSADGNLQAETGHGIFIVRIGNESVKVAI